jgi:hypothetical protein
MRTVLNGIYTMLASLVVMMPAHAAPASEEANSEDAEVRLDELSGSLDDTFGSIDADRETLGKNFKGDFRK